MYSFFQSVFSFVLGATVIGGFVYLVWGLGKMCFASGRKSGQDINVQINVNVTDQPNQQSPINQ